MQISPLELVLDSKNYRLYTLTSSPQNINDQGNIRILMAKNPKVDLQGMVDDILRKKWLSIGERPVVCKEEDKWVVLEGNRRICACQMLLNREYIVEQIRIPDPVPPDVLESLQYIEVDVVAAREDADPIISGKHINATIKWTTISQMRFCVDKFDAGSPIPVILREGAISKQKFIKSLREYRLLYIAVSKADVWSAEEKEALESLDLKPDRYLRLFRSGGAMLRLGLKYDNNNYQLSSSTYTINELSDILTFLARKTLIEGVIDTRYDWLDLFYPRINEHSELLPHVRELWRLMGYTPPTPEPEPETAPPQDEPTEGEGAGSEARTGSGERTTTPSASPLPNSGDQPPRNTPPPIFMANLNCTLTGPDNEGVLLICEEIRRMSQSNTYMRFPIAAAALIRALLEQTFKYHLKHTPYFCGAGTCWAELVANLQPGFDPALGKIIDFIDRKMIRSGHQDSVFPQTTDMHAPKDAFNTLFQDGGVLKRYMDTVIHNPHITASTPYILNELSRGALVSFLNYIYSLH